MNLKYHISEYDAKCPYCDWDCQDDEYILAENMGEQFELKCDHCGKMFYADAGITYSTFSDCNLNGVEHEFEPSKYNDKLFNCKNCYAYEVRK